MSAHDRFREMLARRAELPPPDEADLRVHLHGCPECCARADAYARQTSLLRSMPVVDPPPALRAGVLAATAGAAPVPARAVRTRPTWWPASLAAPAAVAVAAVLAIVFLHRPHTNRPVAVPPTLAPTTRSLPSPTSSATALGRHPSRHHAGAHPTATSTSGTGNPVLAPGGTSVAVNQPTAPAVAAQETPVAAPTTPRASSPSGGHTGGRPAAIPTAAKSNGSGPTVAPQPPPTAPGAPTVATLPPPPATLAPTPIRISPPQPTPTAVVIQPLPTPTSSIGVAALKQPTATPGPGPAAPVTEPTSTPVP